MLFAESNEQFSDIVTIRAYNKLEENPQSKLIKISSDWLNPQDLRNTTMTYPKLLWINKTLSIKKIDK